MCNFFKLFKETKKEYVNQNVSKLERNIPEFKEFDFKGKIRILVAADIHNNDKIIETLKGIPKDSYDVVFTLGDISTEILKYIKVYSAKKVYGILGNHDFEYSLSKAGIEQLDEKVIKINGISFTGISGSFKYKSSCIGYTHEESIRKLANREKVDILISHDTLHGLFERDYRYDTAHQGLQGINEYMKDNKVKINIHGHYHQNRITDLNDKKIISCYGLNLIKINDSEITKKIIC